VYRRGFRHSRAPRVAGTPLWAADGGNGSVVPDSDVQMTSRRSDEMYFLVEAIRSMAEGDSLAALRFAREAVNRLEDEAESRSSSD